MATRTKKLSKDPKAVAARRRRHDKRLAELRATKKKSTQPFAKEFTYKGKTRSIYGWAEELGMSRLTLKKRLVDSGWSVKDALTTPVRDYKKKTRKRKPPKKVKKTRK